MSGNDITKQISLPVYADKLTQNPTKLNLFQTESKQPIDSNYQTALKKSLDAEARRESRTATTTREPSSRLHESSTSRERQLGTDRSERQNRNEIASQRSNSEEHADRRVENERTPVSQSRTDSKREAADSKSATQVSESSLNQNNSEPKARQTEAKTSSLKRNSEQFENSDSVTPQNEAVTEETQKQLDTLNQSVTELVNDNAKNLSKPPASLTEQFALQDSAADAEGDLEQLALNTIQETQAVLTPPSSFSTEVLQNQSGHSEQETNVNESSKSLNEVVKNSVKVNANPNAELTEEQVQTGNGQVSGEGSSEPVLNVAQANPELLQSQTTETSKPIDTQLVKPNSFETEVATPVNQVELKSSEKPVPTAEVSSAESKTENTLPTNLNEVNNAASVETGNVPEVEEKTTKSKDVVEKTVTDNEASQNKQFVNTAVNNEAKQSAIASSVPAETKGQPKQEANKSTTTPNIAAVTNAQKTERQSLEQPQANPNAPKNVSGNDSGQARVTPTAVASPSLGTEPTVSASGKVVEAKTEAVQTLNGIGNSTSAKPAGGERAVVRAPITQTTLPATNSTEFVERLSDSVRVADKNNQTLRVKLTPPQLGSLQIEVAKSEGVVIARLEVQSTSAQQVLMEQLSGLKESLQQNGNNVERIEVHVREPEQPEQNQRNGSGEEQERNSKQEQKEKGRGERQSSDEPNAEHEEAAEESRETTSSQSTEWQMDNLDVEI